MADSVYDILEGNSLSTFPTARGREMTYDRDPSLTYRLPDAEINVYRHKASPEDLWHPFRPSGTFIAEAFLDGSKRFFSGNDEQFRSLDEQIMESIDELDSGEYYKQVNSI